MPNQKAPPEWLRPKLVKPRTFLVFRMWRVQAVDRWAAQDELRRLEEMGVARDALVSQWAKEETPKSLIEQVIKQITG